MIKALSLIGLLLASVFPPPVCADYVDISSSVEITQSARVFDRRNRLFFSYVTIENSSGFDINGPARLVILDPTLPAVNADGQDAQGNALRLVDADPIPAGGKVTIRVDFALQRKALGFTTRLEKEGHVLAFGNGAVLDPPAGDRYVYDPDDGVPFVDGSIIVIAADGVDSGRIEAIAESFGARVVGRYEPANLYTFLLTAKGNSYAAMLQRVSELESLDEIDAAYVDEIPSGNAFSPPNEDFDGLVDESSPIWDDPSAPEGANAHLEFVDAVAAWAFLADRNLDIGGHAIPMGIVDSILETDHDDLVVREDSALLDGDASNDDGIFVDPFLLSPAGIARKGVSDDGYLGHGTFVTGIVAAEWNGAGIAGIVQRKQVFFRPYNSFSFSAYAFFDIAGKKQKSIINFSFGTDIPHVDDDDGTHCFYRVRNAAQAFGFRRITVPRGEECPSFDDELDTEVADVDVPQWIVDRIEDGKSVQTFEHLFSQHPNTLFVQAAGNDAIEAENNGRICGISDAGISNRTLCVASIDIGNANPALSWFSNFGSGVSIAAPGSGIWSTAADASSIAKYARGDGTSFAAPIVTGIAGLVWNAFPSLSVIQVRQALVQGNGGYVADSLGNQIPIANAYQALLCAEKLAAGEAGCLPTANVVAALNDTGYHYCADTHSPYLSCPQPAFPDQDGDLGRDVTHNDPSDGHAGFSFTKLDAAGNDLGPGASAWSCVRDNVTGLVWEGKTLEPNQYLRGPRDLYSTFSWYDADASRNMGDAGLRDGGNCHADIGTCDTASYVDYVNTIGLCGFNDWRLPGREELHSIKDYSRSWPGPMLEPGYFPYAPSQWRWWSEDSYAGAPAKAWMVSFDVSGSISTRPKSDAMGLVLVRK